MRKMLTGATLRRAAHGLIICTVMTGCGSVPEKEELTDEAVLDAVEAMGYERSQIEVDGEFIRIDDDLVLERYRLIAGEYEPTQEQLNESGTISKGWKYFTVSSAYRNNIKLKFSSTTSPSREELPVSTRIKNAFTAAASNWSGALGSSIRINEFNAGSTVTIHMIDGFLWPSFSGCSTNSDACTWAPVGGRPSAHIYVKSVTNTDPSFQPCDWTTSTLAELARHELGHAIGMDHPKDPDAVHITGTMPCAGTASACQVDPGYPTVMTKYYQRSAYPACASTKTVLQKDDLLSADKMY